MVTKHNICNQNIIECTTPITFCLSLCYYVQKAQKSESVTDNTNKIKKMETPDRVNVISTKKLLILVNALEP
jgi:hypothetical protein